MKTTQNNDMTNYIGVVYVKSDIKHSWPIRLGAIYDENQIG